MKKSRYSEAQIVSVLKEAENGVPVSELCRTHGMSSAAFYQWRSKYGGMDASGVVAWITDISERALPETDFMRYARSRGGQVRSYG